MNKVAAIIPFKEKSLGLRGKNFKKILNYPLYELTLIQALNSKLIDKVFISTDFKKIPKKYNNNSKVAFIQRPRKLCKKESSTEEAILHLIKSLDLEKKYTTLVLLQVTSPLRKHFDIDKAINFFKKKKFDSLFSSNKLEDFLFWEKKINTLKAINYNYNKRGIRQNRKNQILENGSIYIFDINKFIIKKNRLFGKIGNFDMETWQQFEIDNFEDYKFTKNISQIYKNKIL